VIVAVDPCLICRGSGLVGKVCFGVGPFLGEGPVETFDFPVRLWSVGARELVGDRGAEGGVEGAGSIAGTVICQDAFDGDAVLVEERVRAQPKPGSGFLLTPTENGASNAN
jgi:hypothetical protein